MFKNRFFKSIVILMLCLSFTGCAALQKKFARREKKEERIAPVVTTYDYSKHLRVDELYKKYFLFWKAWQSELIDRMDSSYKKRSVSFDHILEDLSEMKKYLTDPKASELESFIVEIKSISPDIKKRRLSKGEIYRMRRILEKTKRQIDRRFSYSEVKDQLRPSLMEQSEHK